MLIEVKVKVTWLIDGKPRKKTETCIVPDCELFSNAEYRVMSSLIEEQNSGLVESYEILSLRQSPIKEVCTQWYSDHTLNGYSSFIATLKDTWIDDDGTEKALRYKVLLWAMDHPQALARVQSLVRQGYDMHIEGIKQVDYNYLTNSNNGQ